MCFEHVGWNPFVGLVALRNSDVTDVRTYFGETDPANIPYFDEDGCDGVASGPHLVLMKI